MLKELMNELLAALRKEIERRRGEVGEELCVRLADQFELWDINDCFPTWLSRLVEGELADARNGEGWWFVREESESRETQTQYNARMDRVEQRDRDATDRALGYLD